MRHIGTTLSPAIAAMGLLVGAIPVRGDAHFERDVAPLIVQHCLECHGASKASGGLVLTSRDRVQQGGDSGTSIVPGKPDESLLLQRLVDGEMPPEKHGKSQRLPDDEIARFRAWIAAGATWPERRVLDPYERTTAARGGRDWWSLQPVVRPDVPTVKHAEREATPVDAFILQKLEARGWEPAPPADRRTLIRRLSYDLIGLPPSYAETEMFAADDSPGAYEQLVDRLLASPHYGERWGRYWLDLVRYADTCGYERDQEKPGVWKYRDWVVAALNGDMPYDRFILEQLAGDELPDRSEQSVIATAFLRLGTWNDEPNDPDEYKYERLEDMVHATGTAFLALTVKCARCHDHKFDPIPQVDYYRMASAFWAGYIEPREREWLGGPNKDELGFDVFGWTDRGRKVPPLHLLKSGDPKHPQNVVEPACLSLIPSLATPVAPPPEGAATTQRRLQLAKWIADPRHPLTARVVVNRLWQHHFGQGLVSSTDNFGFTGDPPSHPELLDWLADEFVHPSVVTSSGQTPADLAGKAWTIKRMHKLLVMSSTYRQSSGHPHYDEYAQVDSGNRDCWHAPRRRLDADALRDSLLVASGQIDLRLGGPSFRPTISSEALEGLSRKDNAWKASPPEEQRRRSLYIYLQRSLLPPLMTTFDQSDTTLPCSQRDVTTVAPQALALLNNDFVHAQSAALAQRIVEDAGPGDDERIEAAWKLALGRVPSETEHAAARRHLQAQFERWAAVKEGSTGESTQSDPRQLALESLCHVLLNTNEFLYVD